MNITIQDFTQEHVPLLAAAFGSPPWNKPFFLFKRYLEDQIQGERLVWVAFLENNIAGYVTLKWWSDYLPFQKQNIPEIMDLNVLPEFRNKGLGSHLLKKAEEAAHQKNSSVGLGVGLTDEYGEAQQLYIKKGYIPDGRGITYRYQPVSHGNSILLDDDLVLWLTKDLR